MPSDVLPPIPLSEVPEKPDAFHLFQKPCAGCLYGKKPVVSAARVLSIRSSLRRDGSHFICHVASQAERDVACAGWAREEPHTSNLYRMSLRAGCVQFVEQPPTKKARAK